MTQARDLADGKFDTSTLVVDAANNRVGVAQSTPDAELHIGDGSGSSDNTRLRITGGTSGLSTIQLGDTASANIGQLQYDHSNNFLAVRVNAGERARFLSGGGLTFNGDTAAANALDDYEESSFTPAMVGNTTAGSSPTGTGLATKIGRTVIFNILFANVTVTGGSGAVLITGMPFTPNSNINASFPIASHNLDSSGTFTVATMTGGASNIELLYMRDEASWLNTQIRNASGQYLYITGCFTT